jgi:SAM-dependent methyltransferase
LPFRDGAFASILSNSTLEHIPDLAPVLAEFSRVLADGGVCVITVPSDQFLDSTAGVRFFRLLRLKPLAGLYGRWFNRISRHHHCDSPSVWNERLAQAGLSLLEWRYYFSKGSTGAMDIAHYVSGPSLLTKRLLGRWVLWPNKVRLLPLGRWLGRLAQPGARDGGAYLLLIARKTQPE